MGATEYTIFLAVSFIVSLITFVMGIMAFTVKARGAVMFGILMLAITLWCFSIGGSMLSTTEQMSNGWNSMMMLGVSVAPALYVLFVHYYTGREQQLSWWNVLLLFINPVLAFTFFIIPVTRHLMMSKFHYAHVGSYLITVSYDIGPYYHVHLASTLLMILVGDVLVLQHALQWPKSLRKHLYIVILATMFPIITNLIQTFRIFPDLHGNLDLFGFSIAGILIGIVFYLDKMLELPPLAGRQLMQELPDALLVFDKDWNLVEGNPAAHTLFGQPISETTQQYIDVLRQDIQVDIDDHEPVRKRFVLEKDGMEKHFDVLNSPLMMKSQVVGYSLMFRDVTELIESMNQLELLATTDPLTKLHNRRYYHLEGERIFNLAQRYHHSICVMTFDLDNFKQINDRFGHPAGDEVLVQVAELLKSTSRESDIVARFGGDEFFILLPESGEECAVSLATRLQAWLSENPLNIEGNNVVPVSFSFGIASCDPGEPDSPSLDALMRMADQQLYKAKQRRNN